MYEMFGQWCPKTWHIESKEQLLQAIPEVTTTLGVVKPVDGEEGKDVYIQEKETLSSLELRYPILLQEFLDSSGGVPGIVEGLHDFRVAILNGAIIYSYFRTPPQGSYLANVARGGKFEVIDPEKVPLQFIEVVKKIDEQLEDVGHRFYGIDFAMTPQGPRIIEMNSRLGLLPNSDHPVFLKLKQGLAKSFHEMASSS
jgi:glutathione synthase/RimK-type ligase-like ATP-grasp enzyme